MLSRRSLRHRRARWSCARAPQRGGDSAEGTRGTGVEGKRVEVDLGLLEVGLACCALALLIGYERANCELGEGNGRDQWLGGQGCRVGDALQEDERRGVEDPAQGCRLLGGRGRFAQRLASSSRSTSARNPTGSTAGSRLQRRKRVSAEIGGRDSARSSATGLPERVIVICSPRAARSMTSPPWLRRSRVLTLDMSGNCITGDTGTPSTQLRDLDEPPRSAMCCSGFEEVSDATGVRDNVR